MLLFCFAVSFGDDLVIMLFFLLLLLLCVFILFLILLLFFLLCSHSSYVFLFGFSISSLTSIPMLPYAMPPGRRFADRS